MSELEEQLKATIRKLEIDNATLLSQYNILMTRLGMQERNYLELSHLTEAYREELKRRRSR